MQAAPLTVAGSLLLLVAGLVFVAAFMAYVGIVLGARVPLTIRFVWPLRGMWDPFQACRHRRLFAELVAEDTRIREAQEQSRRALLHAASVAMDRPSSADVLYFQARDPRRC